MEVMMDINSENIQKKEFHIVFKGYKPEEVDKFLDLLAIEFEKLRKKIEDLEENMDSLKYEGDKESVKMKKVIQEALVSAHKVAEEIKQKARTEAGELVNKKRMEEEQAIRKIRTEKEMLQQGIARLKEDYDSFKMQISKFADDFKQKTLSIGGIQLDDTLKKIDLASEKIGMEEVKDISDKEIDDPAANVQDSILPEDNVSSDDSSPGESEYKHAKREMTEENTSPDDNIKDISTISDDIIEKMKYHTGSTKKDKNDIEEDSGSDGTGKEKTAVEDNKEESDKKTRKKIDIANPDIINDFFKTDED